ncbi:hypothetical protein [Pinibacter aurantiacus]|uniref:Uncharacterized protein n=1 Tax=Pinibacter aurantiacus TaxID=2851599 RepID=A0A9E2W6Z7_9BACT|nr:hypothetical protein [Pinibacter aurantiacus]MBV4360604.1 hypothetical protein [Pinibacter aurantiacus]
MLTQNRKYHFVGELLLKKSRVLDEQSRAIDDKVNWLFLNTGERQFSFVYKIEQPLDAEFDKPFRVELAFTMIEAVINAVQLNHTYEVLRGPESIGTVKLIGALE